MIFFVNEDDEYLRWIDQNPTGWVVNARRRPDPSYLILHRSTCAHISTEKRDKWTTGQYIKVCSLRREELGRWSAREIGGVLRHCGCCKEPAVSESTVTRHALHESSTPPSKPFSLWRPQRELAVIESVEPLKASWEKSTDVSQVRLREYRKSVKDRLGACLTSDELYLDLQVALARPDQLLNGNDLENYLTPLFECGCLSAEVFRFVRAEKAVGKQSRLAIGVAEKCHSMPELAEFSHLMIPPMSKSSSDTDWKNALQSSLTTACPDCLPDGEVEVHIAWTCALGRRSWARLWKPVGDAMGPILGSYQRKNRFDPRDDRITKLTYYLSPDESLGTNIGIGFWWRLR
jgi:hypothetical protein